MLPPEAKENAPAATADVLASRRAGDMVIRGGTLRVGGYVFGIALLAAASVLLLRYLGVVGFGHYATVMALVAIVGGVTDAGLQVVGQREYVLADAAGQRSILANIVGIRLVLTPVAVGAAALFAAVAGYGGPLVAGTLIAGAALVIMNAASTMMIGLSANLRLGALTVAEVVKQIAIVAGLVLLVAAGASLVPFFAVHVAAAVVVLGVTIALVDRAHRVGARFDADVWRRLIREAAPLAFSLVLSVVYVRVLLILSSLLVDDVQVGLFGTSQRILESFTAIPVLMVGAAYPILVHAQGGDEERMAYAMQRIGEVALLVAGGLVIVLALGAEPIVRALGGEEYAAAAPVLRIQSFALIGAFMVQVGVYGLVAIREQRALILINALALATVVVLGLVIVPVWEARGAALVASIGEATLALAAMLMLARARPALRPRMGYAARLVLAGALAAVAAVASGLPDVLAAGLALTVYAGAAVALKAVPRELYALVHR